VKDFEAAKKAMEELNNTFLQFKPMMERMDAEVKKYGTVSQETKAAIDAMNNRMDQLEIKMQKSLNWNRGNEERKVVDPEKKAAFNKFCRKGIQFMTPEEQKLLTVGDDTTGGYLAPDDLLAEILADIVEYSPIRSVARVRGTSQRTVKIRKKTGHVAAMWVAESGTKADTSANFKFGMEELPTHEMSGMADISNQDLEDTAFDLEGELRAEFSEQFGVAEGNAFILGNTVGKPEGILFNPALAITASGVANNISADGMISIYYDLKEPYARNGVWLMRRATLKVVRQMKDGNGNYLWEPNFQIGQPPTILARPYVECPDMPPIAPNEFPIAFGDWRRAYLIVDRIAIDILRDPYTQATTGAVRFIARKRVGGQVTVVEAARKLQCSL
jgi:HK97 family phage major capsid protein